ncbi:hypothetical protein JN01_0052 [Entomoplasma freundtii]|uniref:Uncharacterized protein n=1 Tax=Entomoplasma freundtii TaxID=74700 RepID=A0A2K8NS97_9MOLU|nr:hypothetical protein EFREU_v1c07050 [Entomoplasma freundtii]TDY58108.1 hypothetical protein JN01_0052 [Entomoplasma freundtii]
MKCINEKIVDKILSTSIPQASKKIENDIEIMKVISNLSKK